MDDVSREREWQPNLRSAAQEPPGPSEVGTRKRYVSEFLGREIENTYVVVEVEPGGRMLSQTTRDSAASVRTEVTWEGEGAGTRVTMTVEGRPGGLMKLMPRAMLEAAYRKELSASLQRLKECLEV
jgi:carbon monoxide dehydrogenase subunit G